MMGSLLVMAMFGVVAAEIYSYYYGTSKITAFLTGSMGGVFGTIVNLYTDFRTLLQGAWNNFFQAGYMGTSFLLLAVIIFVVVVTWNVLSTIDRNPTLIR